METLDHDAFGYLVRVKATPALPRLEFPHFDIQSTRADMTLCECGWVWCLVPWCVCGRGREGGSE